MAGYRLCVVGRLAKNCIVCEKELLNVFHEAENQPEDGVAFQSEGHYGSTWDPMDGRHLEINVCEECLLDRARKGMVLQGRNRRPVISEGTIVGWERLSRPQVDWDGKCAADDDVVTVAPDEVGAEWLTRTAEGRVRIDWL